MSAKYTLFTIAMFCFLFMLISCQEERIGEGPVQDNGPAINLVDIESGIFIKNAEINDGDIPPSTENFDFEISESISGFLNTGFRVELNFAFESVNGILIQLKDLDGNKVDNHFNLAVDNQLHVIIDGVFEEVVTKGSFCFDLAVYSNQGVSQKKEICVEVRDWGGTNSITGKWKLDKVFFNIDEEIPINDLGEWVDVSIDCQDGNSLETSYQIPFDDYFLEFSENGDYRNSFKKKYQIVDSAASQEACVEKYKDFEENFAYTGKWSHAGNKGELGTVDFSYIDLIDPNRNVQYDYGSIGIIAPSAEVIDDELRLTWDQGTNHEQSWLFKKIESY
ncbi:hypothetical protein [uncultured Marivirga sp.]|uniref:hypothetical protein n=1 Tax=uncultured Marivirga sp. TaxID=1123707 RepID=UPI0030ED7B2A|tara:strand:+ start:425 stop:1429 length:1005 start_codon:yes stop_codon:yes gene_type:complete